MEFFIENWDKNDDEENNALFYAICSESYSAMQWIYENHLDLFNEYNQVKFTEDFSGIASLFKSESLLNWIIKNGNVSSIKEEEAHIILRNMAGAIWIEGLNTIKQVHPGVIENYGSILIYISIVNKKKELFQWVKLNLPDKLMNLEFFEKAVMMGALEIVNWFIEFAPPDILNYTDPNGTNILHLAGRSPSKRVFNVIAEYKKDLLLVPDNLGRYLTEYALNSYNPKRVNTVLQLNKSTTLNLVNAPWMFNREEPNQDWKYVVGEIKDMLVFTASQVLDINFNIQTIKSEFHVLSDEDNLKLQRNVTIAQIEEAKPVIIFWLFVLSELKFPLDIMFEISRKILPQEMPNETINCYSKHFFFVNMDTAETIPLILEEDEDSQEGIQLVNFDSLDAKKYTI